MRQPTFIRLLNSVSVDQVGCWIWQKSTVNSGYGYTSVKRKSILAHRLSYLEFKGKIPDNLFVCHTCDVKLCVNPEHLFLGTHTDNMSDASQKGRLRNQNSGREFCTRGHRMGRRNNWNPPRQVCLKCNNYLASQRGIS